MRRAMRSPRVRRVRGADRHVTVLARSGKDRASHTANFRWCRGGEHFPIGLFRC